MLTKGLFMKRFLLVMIFALIGFSAYCGGLTEADLVNEQEVALNGIHDINVSYNDDSVTVLRSNSSSLVIKEYMNRDRRDYYADISSTGDVLNIVGGKRPLGLFFNAFRSRVEVYLPESFTENVNIKTLDGRIVVDSVNGNFIVETNDGSIKIANLGGSANAKTRDGRIEINSIDGFVVAETGDGSINLSNIGGSTNAKARDGRIEINSIDGFVVAETGDGSINLSNIGGSANVTTRNGRIELDSIDGFVVAETGDGSINLKDINGSVNAKTGDGRIECSLDDVLPNITLNTHDGSVALYVPRNVGFQFSARTNTRLSAPFLDDLMRPANDNHLYHGIIGSENNPDTTIDITTRDGSVNVHWN
jgi:DUF4097 and DUF4098 domain-containing protein YvlB